jgi:hypothetical protein
MVIDLVDSTPIIARVRRISLHTCDVVQFENDILGEGGGGGGRSAREERSAERGISHFHRSGRRKSSELDFEFVTHVELKGLAAPVQASALGEPAPTGARRNSWPLEGGGG